MPSVSCEIIAEITAHMGRFGGDFSGWCVGTARDWHSPVLLGCSATPALRCCGFSIATRIRRRDKPLAPHEVPQGRKTNPALQFSKTKNDDFICREAYTPASARSVRLHFVNDCGAAPASAPPGGHRSPLQQEADDGKLVFAFKKPPARAGAYSLG